MLIQIYQAITTATVVLVSELPGSASDRTEETWRLYRLALLKHIEVIHQVPLAGARGLIARHQLLGSRLLQVMLAALGLIDHHVFPIHLIIYDVGIDDVVTRVEVEFWQRYLGKILVHQRIVDAMTVRESHGVIYHILLGLRVVDNLRCPGSRHILHVGQPQCLHVLSTFQVYADTLVPVYQVVAQHQHHDVVAVPSQSGCHVGACQHKLAALGAGNVGITHAARLRIFLGIKHFSAVKEVVEAVAVTAQGETGNFLRSMHVGIEIAIFIGILGKHIVLHLVSHIAHLQLEHIERVSRNLQLVHIAERLLAGRNHLQRVIHRILIGSAFRSQSNHAALLRLHVLQVQIQGSRLGIRIHHLEIEHTLLFIYLSRLVDELVGRKRELVDGVAIQFAGHLVAIHINLNIIPSVGFYSSRSRGNGGLASVDALLHAVAGVVPSAQVPPAVVVGILVVEDDEEAFASTRLSGSELIGIVRIRDNLGIHVGAVGAASVLRKHAIADAPASLSGIPSGRCSRRR